MRPPTLPAPLRAAAAALLASSALCAPGLALADEGFVKVIPPGNEKVLLEMLGNEPPLPSGCKLEGVQVDRSVVKARYACPGKPEAMVELMHPKAAPAGAQKTERFGLVAGPEVDPALLGALVKRVKDREGSWRWMSAEAVGLGTPPPETTPLPSASTAPLTPEQADKMVAAGKLYREGKYREALAAFIALARQAPQGGVLGMIVASLASSLGDRADVTRLAAEADRNPTDPLPQFVAGVAAHYAGHRLAASVAEKQQFYREALRLLQRARPAYDFEPRLYVYLAVSHFRLNNDAEAQRLIEQAVPLATNDPDVYYCRAEIFQRANLARSIEDIKTYLSMSARLAEQGVPMNQQKHARVEQMLAKLEAVKRGEGQLPADDALFDPVLDPTNAAPAASGEVGPVGIGSPIDGKGGQPPGHAAAPPPLHPALATPRTFAAFAVLIGLVLSALYALGTRKRPTPPS